VILRSARFARLAMSGAAALMAVTAAAAAYAKASAPRQQPTFKSTTALVEVDAVVLDKDGNFVPGLTAENITILENGKPQKIQQFFMVTNNLGQTPGAVASAHADQAQYGAHRVFVMLFDEAHLANESLMRVKRGAEAFIRDMIHDGDAGGVFLNGGMYKGRLTVDKGELLAGVRAVQPAFENRQAILAPFRKWPRINSEVEASRIADGAREVMAALGVKACQEDPPACASEGGLGNVENVIQQKARLYVREARMMTARTMQSLESVAKGLARIPGRKTVVLMTEGFFIEDARGALETIAAQSARSGITIYSIDARGLINGLSVNPDATMMERARSASFDTGEDGPTILTQGTGGFIVRNIDDMSRAFGLIVRDTSTYYVIGYQPDNPEMDGKVRKIEVKSSLPGLKVRARKSYAAVKLPPQEAIWGFTK
jgi:VWFA-related protein